MTCPTCVTLTRERDNARDLAAALEEELARRDGARSDVRASRAPEVAQHLTEQPPIYAANHGWTPSTSPFRHDRCRVMLSRYGCPYSQADHDPALPPEDIDVFGYRRTARSPGRAAVLATDSAAATPMAASGTRW